MYGIFKYGQKQRILTDPTFRIQNFYVPLNDAYLGFLITLLGIFYAIAIMGFVSILIAFLVGENTEEEEEEYKVNVIIIICMFISAVIFAPIFEELLFRGIIMEGYIENYKEEK